MNSEIFFGSGRQEHTWCYRLRRLRLSQPEAACYLVFSSHAVINEVFQLLLREVSNLHFTCLKCISCITCIILVPATK